MSLTAGGLRLFTAFLGFFWTVPLKKEKKKQKNVKFLPFLTAFSRGPLPGPKENFKKKQVGKNKSNPQSYYTLERCKKKFAFVRKIAFFMGVTPSFITCASSVLMYGDFFFIFFALYAMRFFT